MPGAAAALALAFALGLAGCAFEPAAPADGVLVDLAGRTVYVFDQDAPARSNCYELCAVIWPPLAATAGAHPMGEFGVIARDDGRRQWTYRGRPLYHYAVDRGPGDRKGDNARGVWHAVRTSQAAGRAGVGASIGTSIETNID